MTPNYTDSGIIVVNVTIRGIPTLVAVDDLLPFYGNELLFAKKANDSALWLPFLEKAFSKVVGNYENTIYGWSSEGITFLTGAPTMDYFFDDITTINNDPDIAWNIIKEADENDFIMTCSTFWEYSDAVESPYGLPYSHAYTLLGTYELTDELGNVVH